VPPRKVLEDSKRRGEVFWVKVTFATKVKNNNSNIFIAI
jgi:hypothetical protein